MPSSLNDKKVQKREYVQYLIDLLSGAETSARAYPAADRESSMNQYWSDQFARKVLPILASQAAFEPILRGDTETIDAALRELVEDIRLRLKDTLIPGTSMMLGERLASLAVNSPFYRKDRTYTGEGPNRDLSDRARLESALRLIFSDDNVGVPFNDHYFSETRAISLALRWDGSNHSFHFRQFLALIFKAAQGTEYIEDLISNLADIRTAHQKDYDPASTGLLDYQSCYPGAVGRLCSALCRNPQYFKVSVNAEERIRDQICTIINALPLDLQENIATYWEAKIMRADADAREIIENKPALDDAISSFRRHSSIVTSAFVSTFLPDARHLTRERLVEIESCLSAIANLELDSLYQEADNPSDYPFLMKLSNQIQENLLKEAAKRGAQSVKRQINMLQTRFSVISDIAEQEAFLVRCFPTGALTSQTVRLNEVAQELLTTLDALTRAIDEWSMSLDAAAPSLLQQLSEARQEILKAGEKRELLSSLVILRGKVFSFIQKRSTTDALFRPEDIPKKVAAFIIQHLSQKTEAGHYILAMNTAHRRPDFFSVLSDHWSRASVNPQFRQDCLKELIQQWQETNFDKDENKQQQWDYLIYRLKTGGFFQTPEEIEILDGLNDFRQISKAELNLLVGDRAAVLNTFDFSRLCALINEDPLITTKYELNQAIEAQQRSSLVILRDHFLQALTFISRSNALTINVGSPGTAKREQFIKDVMASLTLALMNALGTRSMLREDFYSFRRLIMQCFILKSQAEFYQSAEPFGTQKITEFMGLVRMTNPAGYPLLQGDERPGVVLNLVNVFVGWAYVLARNPMFQECLASQMIRVRWPLSVNVATHSFFLRISATDPLKFVYETLGQKKLTSVDPQYADPLLLLNEARASDERFDTRTFRLKDDKGMVADYRFQRQALPPKLPIEEEIAAAKDDALYYDSDVRGPVLRTEMEGITPITNGLSSYRLELHRLRNLMYPEFAPRVEVIDPASGAETDRSVLAPSSPIHVENQPQGDTAIRSSISFDFRNFHTAFKGRFKGTNSVGVKAMIRYMDGLSEPISLMNLGREIQRIADSRRDRSLSKFHLCGLFGLKGRMPEVRELYALLSRPECSNEADSADLFQRICDTMLSRQVVLTSNGAGCK